MFAAARRFVTVSVLSVPSWRSRDECGAIFPEVSVLGQKVHRWPHRDDQLDAHGEA
jgi:hypothetical protein